MRTIALAICVIAVLGCKKSNSTGDPGSGSSGATNRGSSNTTGGSDTGGSSGSGGSGVTTGGSGGSAATPGGFDDKLEIAKQPDRPKDQQAYVDAAATSIRTVLTSAKNAKNAVEFCKAFVPLGKQVANLYKVDPPTGVDAQEFSDKRLALVDKITISHPGPCDDPANASLDDMRDLMADIRDAFVAFATMGAK